MLSSSVSCSQALPSGSASDSQWKLDAGPFAVAWYPGRTGWAAVAPGGRVFVLRAITKSRGHRALYDVWEAGDEDYLGTHGSLGLGLAFGMGHARRMIARYCLRYPLS